MKEGSEPALWSGRGSFYFLVWNMVFYRAFQMAPHLYANRNTNLLGNVKAQGCLALLNSSVVTYYLCTEVTVHNSNYFK